MEESLGDFIQENLILIYKILSKTKSSKKIIFKLFDIFEKLDIEDFDDDDSD